MAEKNYVKVGGQLQNIVGDGILAYSKEIKDEVREKTQEQINTETYEKVAEIDEALSSLSPEQGEALALSERVGQLEKEVGYHECSTSSGTATKQVVVDGYALSSGCSIKVKMLNKNTAATNVTLKIGSSEAKPLYYAGKLVSAANTWDAGEVLDIYYNPNNGGAYYANNVEGGSADGVFDVSDYNKSGDPLEPTKYIDLAAALGTNGNNIPENHRKGGMLIKFIELESLEYKQYRYMGTAVSGTSFTDTANWQGADSVPTEDSRNLVESGGVFEECVEAGDPVGDPVGDWVPSEAEAYVDQKVAEERARAIARENQLLKVYETFTQSNLVIGALPATGKVNTIYRVPGTNSYADYMYAASDLHTPILMATYNNDIDEIPTAGSQNLVKSGGVAREIVWDVTARNSNTTFASLNALLSDANIATLIPTTIRRGGMQIRFVLSSDNKYVQYFLTKNEWSASAADWDKLNLEEEVNQIGQEIDYFDTTINGELDNPNIVWQREGYYINKIGIVQSNPDWKISAPILLKAGVTIVVKTQGQACVIIASTVDGSSYTPIVTASDVTSGLLTYSYCPVTDETIAIAAKTGMGDTSVSFYTDPLLAPVNGYEKDITPNGTWDWSIIGKYITPQGVPTNTSGWGISYPRLLKKGQIITVGTQGSGACVIAKPTNSQNYEPLVNIPSNTTGWHEYSYTAEEDITIVFAAKYGLGDVSVVVSQAGIDNRIETLENEVLTLDGRVKSIEVYMKSYSDGCLNTDGIVQANQGWYHNDEYIPVSSGDIIVWNPALTGQSPSLIGYDANKQKNHYWAAIAVSRTITVPNDMAFVRCSFVLEVSDGQGGTTTNDTPISVGDKVYKINDITLLNNLKNGISIVDDTHGIIGQYYPEEVKIIENQLRAKLSNRFQFLHISDNHGLDFGYAQEFLDYCQAKFLVNTGDMVANTFADLAQSRTIELAQEPTKPVYLIPGNHDYVGAPSKAAVFNAFVGAINEHNGTSFDKSYYSIDYTTEAIKAIFLDGYDGWDDSDYATLQPGPAGLGKMSQAQINWFASELQDAITNSLHVVVFIHEKVDEIDRFKNIPDFYDTAAGQTFNLPFLVQMIDAFMDGTSCSFEYNGNAYSFTFSGSGHFVAWIGGHYHGDICGWITGHERQFVSIVCRPFRDSTQYSGSYDADKLGVHFNFCTIDTVTKTFSVYRVGQQSTIYGTPRIAFSIKYL